MDRTSFLKFESVSGVLALSGYHTMPRGLYDRTAFPVLKAIVGGDTEVDASGVPEFIDVDAPDCCPELLIIRFS